MAIIITGERSGVGKTTITLAILSYLQSKGYSLQSFKVGPDYIDPMFHTNITGQPCRNLDPILTSEDYVRWCFNYHSQNASMSVIEGVMGLFDGVPNHSSCDYGSTAHIARLLDLPVILIIDCSKLSVSVGAIAFGYTQFDRRVKIVGIILNKVASQKHLSLLKEGLQALNIPIMGIWFRQQQLTLPSRHLGLIPTEERAEYPQIFEQLGEQAQNNINWDLLLPYLKNKNNLSTEHFLISNKEKYNLRIAIAKDKSFNFYYQDNLDILAYLGAKLIPFSPLQDSFLPADIDALYLGGGFPEVFAPQLAKNITLKLNIKKAINNGLPTYAECGGMMYLSEAIVDFEGQKWSMVGVLPNEAIMSKKLTLGYRKASSLINSNFLVKDTILSGHEFHRAVNSQASRSSIIKLKDYYSHSHLLSQGWQINNVYCSYLHLHFGNIIPVVKTFLQGCLSLTMGTPKGRFLPFDLGM